MPDSQTDVATSDTSSKTSYCRYNGCFDAFIEPIKAILHVFLKVLRNASGCELLRNENGSTFTFLHFSEIVC